MNVGIIGAGNIAGKMAGTIREMDDAVCYGIASRDLVKSEAFAKEYGVTKAYGSYEELVKDEVIDLVYVATPHAFHKEHAMLAIQHGKAVLCEKAFTANAKEAKAVLDLGKEKNVLVAEAIWTRYMPSRTIIDDIIASGKIGEVMSVSASLGYNLMHVERMVNPSLAGGALLDLGVYVINFAGMILGLDVEEIMSSCVKGETGVDLQETIVFKYPGGKQATLQCGAYAATEQYGMVYGREGYIMGKNLNNIDVIEVYNKDRELIETHNIPEQITGFEDQVRACMKAMKEGKLECEAMPHSEIMKVMEIMDGLRAEWGVKYPFE